MSNAPMTFFSPGRPPAGAASSRDAAAPTSGLRADVRDEIRRERAALADPVRRVTREIVREELAAANPTPAEKVRRAAQEARALSTDPSERKRLALSVVRGLGVGLPSDELAQLAQETALLARSTFSSAVLALTTEDAR